MRKDDKREALKFPFEFEVPFYLCRTFSSIGQARYRFAEPDAEVGG